MLARSGNTNKGSHWWLLSKEEMDPMERVMTIDRFQPVD